MIKINWKHIGIIFILIIQLSLIACSSDHDDTLLPEDSILSSLERQSLILRPALCTGVVFPVVADWHAPKIPVPETATVTECNSVELTWEASYDIDSVLKEYRIYKNGILFASTMGTPPALGLKSRYFKAVDLEHNMYHTFIISAMDIYGNESARSEFPQVLIGSTVYPECRDTTPPTQPRGLQITAKRNDCNSLYIKANTPSTDSGSGIKGYNIYRDRIKIYSNSVIPSCWDSYGIVPGSTYRYWMTAVDKAGNESAPGEYIDYTVPACDTVMSNGDFKTALIGVKIPDTCPLDYTLVQLRDAIFGGGCAGEQPVALFTSMFSYNPIVHCKPLPSLKEYFNEVSYETIDFINTRTIGWITLPGEKSDYCSKVNSVGLCTEIDGRKVMSTALRIAKQHFSFDPNNEGIKRIIFVVNGQRQRAAYGDRIFLSANEISLERFTGVAIHEMGHTFGIDHAAAWEGRNFDEAVGNRLSIPVSIRDIPFASSFLSEYGDPYNRMGGPYMYHFSVYQKELMGILTRDQIGYARTNGYYTIDQVEFPSTGIKQLRIPAEMKGSTVKAPFLVAEYRSGRGYNGGSSGADEIFRGVQIRLVPDRFPGVKSDVFYIGSVTDRDPVFEDWYRGIRITLVDMNNDSATIQICGISYMSNTEKKIDSVSRGDR